LCSAWSAGNVAAKRPPGRSVEAAGREAGGGSYFVATVLPAVSLMPAHFVWMTAFRESGSGT
jgi:hypothetical protein